MGAWGGMVTYFEVLLFDTVNILEINVWYFFWKVVASRWYKIYKYEFLL